MVGHRLVWLPPIAGATRKNAVSPRRRKASERARSQAVADKDGFVDTERERERERGEKREKRWWRWWRRREENEEAGQELVPSITQDGESCMRLATPPEG